MDRKGRIVTGRKRKMIILAERTANAIRAGVPLTGDL